MIYVKCTIACLSFPVNVRVADRNFLFYEMKYFKTSILQKNFIGTKHGPVD